MASGFSIDVNPAVLRWARIAAGQKLSDVAVKLSVPEETVLQWETGNKPPAWQSLRKLAKCYQRPIAALLLPEPPDEPDTPPDFRTMPVARRDLSPSTLLAIRTARWLQGRAIEMRRELEISVPFANRKIRLTDNPDTAATSARRHLGIDLDQQTSWSESYEAFRRWKNALGEEGLLVFQFRFPRDEVQGFSLVDRQCPVIVVNEEDAVEARIFTLFHEYAHLLLRESGMCMPQLTPSATGNNIEPFCNRFAASLLVPTQEVQSWEISLGRSATDNDAMIRRFAKRYRVSRDVVLIRLRDTDRITGEAFARIYARWKKERSRPMATDKAPKAPRAGGRSALQKAVQQRGSSFVDLVLQATKRDAITIHDAMNYLGIKLKDLSKLESRK